MGRNADHYPRCSWKNPNLSILQALKQTHLIPWSVSRYLPKKKLIPHCTYPIVSTPQLPTDDMLLQTSKYLSILKITASYFRRMLFRDSTLQRQHELDFEKKQTVPFVISWPICCAYLILIETRKVNMCFCCL